MTTGKWEMQVTDKVKIQQHDAHNFTLLVLTEGVNPRTKETVESYKVVGYYSTVRKAVLALIAKDILIDLNEVKTIRDYVKASKKQHEAVRKLLEGE